MDILDFSGYYPAVLNVSPSVAVWSCGRKGDSHISDEPCVSVMGLTVQAETLSEARLPSECQGIEL